ncbi:TetR/AcrR family transcriptional regulator [Streptomyces corynorhini]|uniref:TetR/AcrR family transcriptional regulator n=1 Tax=Streptomyces corynorhini TaxID=2282652 RepID=A0A370B4Y7_9ACTN|nr:TetR/AcrR family transcriptional regulator [Streptomyces corynorhini]RDG34806.1 TetR/AcrR family transcriptional regulator [Streptomyces corynorhini]
MARVSQEHLDARRRQILEGAARCFTANGFHATSMQEVLREVDLSAGAVYRYFGGKDELIGAIAADVLDGVRGAFDRAAATRPLPPPDVLLGEVMRELLESGGLVGDDMRTSSRLIVQVWSETLRNEELAEVLRDGFRKLRAVWIPLIETYQETGLMRADVPAPDVARTMIATVQGFMAQQALFGEMPIEVLQNGLRGLMSMGEREPSGVPAVNAPVKLPS